MLVVETIARIRREHFIKGKTIKEIARDLKVSRNTVRKVLRSGETSFEYERQVQPRPKLGRWAVELDGLLAANAAKSAREQLTLIRIFEELRAVAAMTAATMRCDVTPGGGARNAGNRPRRPMSR
ncbi:putative transcriptional regulator [Bradyrhizobium barranii subsp. barranii]